MKKITRMLALASLLALSACSDGMKGVYEGPAFSLDFHGNGKVTQVSELVGAEVQLDYEIDGNKVRLRNPDQPGAVLVLTRTDDDTLVGGPMGLMQFKRKQ